MLRLTRRALSDVRTKVPEDMRRRGWMKPHKALRRAAKEEREAGWVHPVSSAAKVPQLLPAELHPHPAADQQAAQQPLPLPLPFAVVEIDGKQHKVVAGDVVMLDSQRGTGVGIGESAGSARVLLVGGRDGTVVGRPLVEGARVEYTVQEHTHTQKVLTFKKRRRKGSSKSLHGIRPQVTVVRIDQVVVPPQFVEGLGARC